MADSKALGRAIQKLRQEKRLTQDDLSDKAGLAYSTLAKIERGAIKNPSIFTVQALAGVLEVSIEEILGLKTKPKPLKVLPSQEISFVYCDVNGVLVRFYQRAFTAMAKDFGVSMDRVESAFWHYCDAVNSGQISLEDYQKAWSARLGISEPIDWKHYYYEAIEPIQAMHDWLEQTSKHHSVGLISNIFPGFLKEMIKLNLLPKLDYAAIIDSSEVRALKPAAKIYEVAEVAAKCPPEQILLIDDTPSNLRAAELRHWRVFWFDDSRPKESVERLGKVVNSK